MPCLNVVATVVGVDKMPLGARKQRFRNVLVRLTTLIGRSCASWAIYRWFAFDVMAAMLVVKHKRTCY